MADKIKCKSGWLIAPNEEDGSYVPFFVKVRGKDIKWSEFDFPNDLKNFVSKLGAIKVVPPATTVRIDYMGWKITINSDYSYEATRKINVADTFGFYNDDKTDLYAKIMFPFKTMNDNALSVQCTQSARAEELLTGSINVLLDYGDNTMTVDAFDIHLRNLIYTFDEDFNTNTEYRNSFVFATVKGVLIV